MVRELEAHLRSLDATVCLGRVTAPLLRGVVTAAPRLVHAAVQVAAPRVDAYSQATVGQAEAAVQVATAGADTATQAGVPQVAVGWADAS